MSDLIKRFMHCYNIYPRRWLKGLISYSRYIGYIKPILSVGSEEEYKIRRKLIAQSWEPRQLSLPVGERILVLSPHPDDESVGSGGLLWAHRNSSEIHFIVLSKGEAGGALDSNPRNHVQYKASLSTTRKSEFFRITSMLNAKSSNFLDFPDGSIPYDNEARDKLRSYIDRIKPDVVVLPWFLDDHVDHRRTNILYAKSCRDLEVTVLAYEIWTMLEPNAIFDMSEHLDGKLSLIRNYESQLKTVDYINYVVGLSKVRAYQYPVNPRKEGAVEAYLALPNHEYCDLVRSIYGEEK